MEKCTRTLVLGTSAKHEHASSGQPRFSIASHASSSVSSRRLEATRASQPPSQSYERSTTWQHSDLCIRNEAPLGPMLRARVIFSSKSSNHYRRKRASHCVIRLQFFSSQPHRRKAHQGEDPVFLRTQANSCHDLRSTGF